MATPSLTYDFYRNTYKGSLGEGELDAPLVKAQALLVSMTGEEVPEKYSEKWLLALCALCARAWVACHTPTQTLRQVSLTSPACIPS